MKKGTKTICNQAKISYKKIYTDNKRRILRWCRLVREPDFQKELKSRKPDGGSKGRGNYAENYEKGGMHLRMYMCMCVCIRMYVTMYIHKTKTV